MKNINLLVLGFAAGFCSAALGIGGGVIIVSSLVIFSGYDIKKAIGTSLAAIVPATLVGVISHYMIKSSNIRLFTALFIIIGSVTSAKFGAALSNKIRSVILKRLFSLLLLFAGLKLTNIINIPTETISSFTAYPVLIILGMAAGTASALFGIGGGVIMVPALNLFFGLSIHEAVATSLTVILPTTFAGALFHKKFNNLNIEAIKFLIPTSLIGAVLGAVTANSLPSAALKTIFGIFMILSSVRIFFQKQ